ncbi:serine acetyltransferase 1, chloroplastic [Dorcoceras hygrometricum]|uniref:serine O-acetyltransferase n=1 Tax=Dorcoceras hygrometricum TaxID=472368 RepID=A0A2Z7D0P8_9LAMI|nr:serine acetyltransferase 1, chloroplastic [Dorcoceras hygrometricum]
MAACVDSSRNHATHHTASCSGTNPLCKIITRFCKPSTPNLDSSRFLNPHAYYKKVNDPRRVNPEEYSEDLIWPKIREEAAFDIRQEPMLSKFYHSTILSHTSLERALANHLALKLCNANISREALCDVFLKALLEDAEIQSAMRYDLKAVRERDPACVSYVHCFLNFKGFLACQAYRLAHKFWIQGRKVLAFLIQNQVSEVFAMDIHPGAKIGPGIVFDHGTGVVIGETTVIGKDVTIFHNVTLGGTGKAEGDRHPKIGNGVLVGAGAKVLGNVRIGDQAKIGAGSLVLKEVPPKATAVGNPARTVGSRRAHTE